MKNALIEINAFGEKFLSSITFEYLCATAQGIQSMYKIMQSMRPDVKTGNSSSKNYLIVIYDA